MDETQRAKYTFRVHGDANKLQVKAAVEELFKVDVLDGQRVDHQAQGEVAQPRTVAHQGLDARPGRRPSSPSPPARRSNSSRGCRDAAANLQAHLRRPPLPGRADLRGDHDRQAAQAPARAQAAHQRPQQPGPHDRAPSRRRREAPLPAHRLQARQARRARGAGDGRVRPQPLGAHRPAALPRRRQALHARAQRPERG